MLYYLSQGQDTPCHSPVMNCSKNANISSKKHVHKKMFIRDSWPTNANVPNVVVSNNDDLDDFKKENSISSNLTFNNLAVRTFDSGTTQVYI